MSSTADVFAQTRFASDAERQAAANALIQQLEAELQEARAQLRAAQTREKLTQAQNGLLYAKACHQQLTNQVLAASLQQHALPVLEVHGTPQQLSMLKAAVAESINGGHIKPVGWLVHTKHNYSRGADGWDNFYKIGEPSTPIDAFGQWIPGHGQHYQWNHKTIEVTSQQLLFSVEGAEFKELLQSVSK